jgi:hypothetical protein
MVEEGPMKSVEVELACECGWHVVARSGDAGDSIPCRCGRTVNVPNLGRLRMMAGQDAYVTNPAEAIAKLQRTGGSPAGNNCLLCGSHSPTLYRCDANCESSHVKGATEKNFSMILSWLAFVSMAFFAGLAFLRQSKETQLEVRGHDVAVTFDIPLCDACLATAGSPERIKNAKRLMGLVPPYRELLTHYPDLVLKVKKLAA